jgi:FixJ family two-component response regulator
MTASGVAQNGHVYVVDDDPAFRAAVTDLLEAENLGCSAFESTEGLLASELSEEPACLVLDVQLPGVSGLDLQVQMQALDHQIPIVFITGHGDVEMCACAMKRGASQFLTKPFSAERLLEAVHEALEDDRRRASGRKATRAATEALRSLTAREVDVMALVTEGLLNKQIADRLAISEVTVKLHRGNAMRKFGVRSLARWMTMMGQLPPNALLDARRKQ